MPRDQSENASGGFSGARAAGRRVAAVRPGHTEVWLRGRRTDPERCSPDLSVLTSEAPGCLADGQAPIQQVQCRDGGRGGVSGAAADHTLPGRGGEPGSE